MLLLHFKSEKTEAREGKTLAQGHTVKYPHSWTVHSYISGVQVQGSFFTQHWEIPACSHRLLLRFIIWLWTNLSASLISRFLNYEMKRWGQIIPMVLLGHRPSHLMVESPQTFRSWPISIMLNPPSPHPRKKLYPSPCPSTDEFIAGSTEGLSPHLPGDQAQGWTLYMLYLISSLKTPWRVSITLPNFYMKKLRLSEVNGCLGQMD